MSEKPKKPAGKVKNGPSIDDPYKNQAVQHTLKTEQREKVKEKEK